MIAIALTLILLAIAALHIAWGFGYWWPIRDEAALARAVVGTRSVRRMPGPVACGLVAVALIAAGWWVWFGGFSGIGLWRVGMGVLGTVFLLRGAAAYTATFRRITPEQPFARFDRRYYGPLCVILGGAFMILSLRGAP